MVYRTQHIIQRFVGSPIEDSDGERLFVVAKEGKNTVELSMLTNTGWIPLERWAIGDFADETDQIEVAEQLLGYYTENFQRSEYEDPEV